MTLTPFQFDDSVPKEEYISWAVCRLLGNKSKGPFGMSAYHLRSWMQSATREAPPAPASWGKVAGLIQSAFCYGHIMEDYSLQTDVLIPKVNRDFQVISLVEVLWKTVTGILNRHYQA